ncbi:hypothetical protein BDZ94DRAFT_1319199 [Collybia nuda]|uniref:AB hydrolase-1 domain-containing protein n=1 Tax=Collybia nuda TaxID=64659 RepID=A0A9P6CN75_9AGAR|nr:hypothetical protein BDZ94DRAFT_1319199 [Collybia nuda]
MLNLAIYLLLAGSAWSLTTGSSCIDGLVPVKVSADPIKFDLPPPNSQSDLTAFLTRLTSETSNVTSAIKGRAVHLEATYNIWSMLCIPAGFPQNGSGIVEFAIHGINFDHSYWNFGGPGSPYNYVDAALEAGHAVFIYDRLGVGKSSKPDGIQEVQLATEIEVAASLVDILKCSNEGCTGGAGRDTFISEIELKNATFIGVGHSFGSLQLSGLASKYGNLFDASILTGFSSYSGGQKASLVAFGLTIASQQNPKRFGSLSSSYLATEGIYNDQMNFFRYPSFNFSALQLALDTKGTLTIGELLTQSTSPALNYTKPVFIVTGDKVFIFCGGDCYQALNGSGNLIDSTNTLFPATSDFSTYIPSETGHAVNVHYSAPGTYREIQAWISKRFGDRTSHSV